MLTHIHIWNFAIVEKMDLPFEGGLTVMTGETGAGKSILLDALSLALGDRADSSVIRHGADKAEVSVTFDTRDTPEAEAWLQEREMASENECIVRRTVSANGPSKAFINGVPSTIQGLRELGEMLLDLHGQHEHQSLLKRDTQRQLLDDFATHGPLLLKLEHAFNEWKGLNDEYQRLQTAKQDRDARLELLRYQVQELSALDMKEGENDALEQEFKRLSNASRLLETAERSLQRLDDDEHGVSRVLGQGHHELDILRETDAALANIADMLSSAVIQVDETISELRHYLDNLELDPERLKWLDERIGDIHNLSRKHHVNPDQLHTLLPRLQTELDELENADIRLEKMQKDISSAARHYQQLADTLSTGRQQAANKLNQAVSASMQELGMQGGQFEVRLQPEPQGHFSPNGMETIDFLVTANPGQPLKPLNKVASGGELSRISLAIQVITAEQTRISTLVFDEVDVGIGGRIAEIVGYKLRTLAGHRQVLCVTHLPQVAALGHHHLQVSKRIDKDLTITQIQPLEKKQRVDEVARMLGGVEITEQTLSHAKEMLERAQT